MSANLDLFNVYRTIAPSVFVAWALAIVWPLLRAELGWSADRADWTAAVTLPTTRLQVLATEASVTQLLCTASVNWVVDALLRRRIFPTKPLPWDYLLHHATGVLASCFVLFLGWGYGYTCLALIAESYATVVFFSQLSFMRTKDKPSRSDRCKKVTLHVASLVTLLLVREPIWVFIMLRLALTHVPEASDWAHRCMVLILCAVPAVLLYLDLWVWARYHAGELRSSEIRGVKAN